MKNAAIYVRISNDPDLLRLGVQRQEKECRELAKRLGWKVAKVYEDDDRSAFNRKVKREGYRALLADIKAGAVDALIAWHPDRMHRQPRELEELIDVVEARDIQVATVRAGNIDLSNPSGRLMARHLVNFAAYESEHRSERVRAKMAEIRSNGQFHGGLRPFGYAADGVTVVPKEAAAVVEAKDRLLSGESLWSVVRDFDERQIRGTQGRPLSRVALRQILISPRVAGLNARRGGEIVGQATWPALLEEGDWARLRSLFEASRAIRQRTRTPHKYLLTRLLTCGRCSQPLYGHRMGGEHFVYDCKTGPGYGGCGRTSVQMAQAESVVQQLAMEWIQNPGFLRALNRAEAPGTNIGELAGQINAVDARLTELAAAYGEHQLSYSEWMAARKPLQARLELAKQNIAQAEARGNLTALGDVKNLPKQWEALPMDRRRAVLSALLERVEVHPHQGSQRKPDLSRFRPIWKV